MKRVVSVIGGGACAPEEAARAEAVGRLLAERGYTVLTGGLGGVMEAASRGAADAGGLTVGVLPGRMREEANPYVGIALPTGLGEARNIIVATSGDAVIAIGGGMGTLTEIGFALKHRIPVIGLDTWSLPETRVPGDSIRRAESPDEAVAIVDGLLTRGGGEE